MGRVKDEMGCGPVLNICGEWTGFKRGVGIGPRFSWVLGSVLLGLV